MSITHFDPPGPSGRRKIAVINVIGAAVILGLGVWVIIGLASQGQFTAAKWTPFLNSDTWVHFLLPGLFATLKAAGLAVVLSLFFGILLGLGRTSRVALIRGTCAVIVEFFRAVPVLIMMLFGYTVLAATDWVPSSQAPMIGVVAGLTLYNSAVIAELVRSGIASLPKGQREAAYAIGLTRGGSQRLVELPQALTVMLPSLVAQLVIILKDTGLGYLINYPELLRQARLLGSTEANLLPALLVAAVMFIIINNLLTYLAGRLSRMSSRRAAVSC